MKIRKGFVSNSSSSSFIIRLNKGTTEVEAKYIFENKIDSYLDQVKQQIKDRLFDVFSNYDQEEEEYSIYFSDEDGGLDQFICDFVEIQYEDDKIEMFKEGGY